MDSHLWNASLVIEGQTLFVRERVAASRGLSIAQRREQWLQCGTLAFPGLSKDNNAELGPVLHHAHVEGAAEHVPLYCLNA